MVNLRSFVFMICFYFGSVLLAISLLPLLVSRQSASLAGRIWGRFCVLCCHIVGLTHKCEGDMALGEQVIYAVKHQSAWETLVLYEALSSPLVVLKRELLHIPIIGQFMRRAGVVAINRAQGMAALRQMKDEAETARKTGRSLLIFPQGTRVAAKTKAPYHSGVFLMYQSTGLAVVPVALNSGMFWGRAAWRKFPGSITVRFLPKIPPDLGKAEFMEQLEQAIETHTALLEAQAEASSQPNFEHPAQS